MSNKINQQIQDKDEDPKKYIIYPFEYNFLNSLDTIKQSFAYYLSQAQSEYLKIISVRLGYAPEDDLEFNIDLKDTKMELTITPVQIPEEDKYLKNNPIDNAK